MDQGSSLREWSRSRGVLGKISMCVCARVCVCACVCVYMGFSVCVCRCMVVQQSITSSQATPMNWAEFSSSRELRCVPPHARAFVRACVRVCVRASREKIDHQSHDCVVSVYHTLRHHRTSYQKSLSREKSSSPKP